MKLDIDLLLDEQAAREEASRALDAHTNVMNKINQQFVLFLDSFEWLVAQSISDDPQSVIDNKKLDSEIASIEIKDRNINIIVTSYYNYHVPISMEVNTTVDEIEQRDILDLTTEHFLINFKSTPNEMRQKVKTLLSQYNESSDNPPQFEANFDFDDQSDQSHDEDPKKKKVLH